MATQIGERSALGVETSRRLLLIWQNPADRRLIRVGELDALVDGHFTFRYLPAAEDPEFSPLVQFPELDKVYGSATVPAFFRNRVMSSSRPSYVDFRRWIGLEFLAPTQRERETFTAHVHYVRDNAGDWIFDPDQRAVAHFEFNSHGGAQL